MSIVPPAQCPWRTRPADPPPVGVEVTRYGDGDVTARLGAAPADIAAALARIPAGARLTGVHFGTGVTLLFRTDPPGDDQLDPPAACPGTWPERPRQAA